MSVPPDRRLKLHPGQYKLLQPSRRLAVFHPASDYTKSHLSIPTSADGRIAGWLGPVLETIASSYPRWLAVDWAADPAILACRAELAAWPRGAYWCSLCWGPTSGYEGNENWRQCTCCGRVWLRLQPKRERTLLHVAGQRAGKRASKRARR